MTLYHFPLRQNERLLVRARLKAARLRDPGDGSEICKELNKIARDVGVTNICEEAGLERTGFYRTFNGSTDPKFSHIIKLIHALDIGLLIK